MAFQHGKSTLVYVNQFDLSTYFNEASLAATVDPAETTTFTKTVKVYIAGTVDGTISLRGLFDGSADAVDEELSNLLGTSSPQAVTLAIEGSTVIGKRVACADNIITSYEVSAPVADVVSVNAEFQASGGAKSGWSLHDAATAITASEVSNTSVDTTSAANPTSTNGAMSLLHVTDITGTSPTITVKVQHSADNITFADLVTFTQATATTNRGQAISTPNSTTINRYVRAISTVAGTTPSIKYTVSFIRF